MVTAFAAVGLYAATTAPSITGDLPYRGQSLSGAEFGAQTIPGTYASQYYYPTVDEAEYFMGKGMNTFRLPFLWERLQPKLDSAFDSLELKRIHAFVDPVTTDGAFVILDPHDYGRRNKDAGNPQVIGTDITNAQFSAFWVKLASEFKSNSHVIFGLMNEPCPNCGGATLTTAAWETSAQSAINAIRTNGATNLILVPGNYWTGAHSWTTANYGGGATTNAATMINITDPANNFAFEVHQYFDTDFSGTLTSCTQSADTINTFTKWLRANGKKAFLGEFAGGNGADCQAVIANLLTNLESNGDVWLGYAWWASGPWWGWIAGSGYYSLDPVNGTTATQLTWLLPHLSWRSNGTASSSSTSSSSGTTSSSSSATNLLKNGTFSTGDTSGWNLVVTGDTAKATMSVVNGALQVNVSAVDAENYHIQIQQTGLSLIAGHTYALSFDISATTSMWPFVEVANTKPWGDLIGNAFQATATTKTISYTFTADSAVAAAVFQFSVGNVVNVLTLDNISLVDNNATSSVINASSNVNNSVVVTKVHDVLFVRSNSGVIYDAHLLDLKGRLVSSLNHEKGSIDLSSIENGMYILQINSNLGTKSMTIFR